MKKILYENPVSDYLSDEFKNRAREASKAIYNNPENPAPSSSQLTSLMSSLPRMESNKTQELFDEAIKNIRKDRKETEGLLKDLMRDIKADKTDYARSGGTTAKYLESLQRSNEQLVKIVMTLMKQQGDLNEELDDDEKAEVYELIQGGNRRRIED